MSIYLDLQVACSNFSVDVLFPHTLDTVHMYVPKSLEVTVIIADELVDNTFIDPPTTKPIV